MQDDINVDSVTIPEISHSQEESSATPRPYAGSEYIELSLSKCRKGVLCIQMYTGTNGYKKEETFFCESYLRHVEYFT